MSLLSRRARWWLAVPSALAIGAVGCGRDAPRGGDSVATAGRDTAAADSTGDELVPGSERPLARAELANGDCLVFAGYTVQTIDRAADAGETIRVAARDSAQPAAPRCDLPAPAPFVVDDGAVYFAGLVGNALIVDEGTGPLRELRVYDLAARRQIHTASYVEWIGVDDQRRLAYWEDLGTSGRQFPCPQADSLKAKGLDVGHEERVVVDLAQGAVERTGDIRCSGRQ